MEQYHTTEAVKRQSPSRAKEIPQALKDIPRWMGTRFQPRKGQPGKVDKPPYRMRPGEPIIKADKTRQENWTTYANALAALERGDVDAIGYVFTEDDPHFVVDLDDVIDHDTGEIQPAAAEVIHTMDTYGERSCSGAGVHLIGEGQKPEWAGCKAKKMGPTVELYDSKRFVVLTGDRIGSHREPLERQEKLEWLCQRLWIKAERFANRPTPEPVAVDIEDAALLERARNASSGAKFARLFDHGDTSGYDSPSNADFALLNMLAFWTAGDPERMARLFEMSALYRTPQGGKHKNYVALSVSNALKDYTGPFYRPRKIDDARKEEPTEPLAPYLELLLDPSLWTGRKAASAYKATAGMVILAEEYGIKDDEDFLRIGCDLRRLAEVSGTTIQTLSSSALPTLMKDMKLLKWRRGKGKSAGVLTLKNPAVIGLNNKVATHSNVQGYDNAKNVLKTIGLLIRMRYGPSGSATLEKLGMPAMFAIIAMLPGSPCGYTLDELAERTGRQKSHLKHTYMPRLKAAEIVKEIAPNTYRLTKEFASCYARHLDMSGVISAERRQKRRHEYDRRRRDAKIPTHKPPKMRGKEHMRRVVQECARKEEREKWVEEQRQKVGASVATFIADELHGVIAVNFHAMRGRYQERGGSATELWYAIRNGPWQMYRETDGDLYVRVEDVS